MKNLQVQVVEWRDQSHGITLSWIPGGVLFEYSDGYCPGGEPCSADQLPRPIPEYGITELRFRD